MVTRSHPSVAARFDFGDLEGAVVERFRPRDLESALRRVIDPAQARETVHWGRNYLYRARFGDPAGAGGERGVDVVVKQYRNRGLKSRLRRALAGTKASRSWRMARAYEAAGIPTASPVARIESKSSTGPGFFISRDLGRTLEARYLLRAMNAGTVADDYPGIDPNRFLDDLGRLIASMHSAGLFHRDLSIGNVLLVWPDADSREDVDRDPAADPPAPQLHVVDLGRSRRSRRLGLLDRNRDLCRLTIHRRDDQLRFLEAYWGEAPGTLRTAVYDLLHHGFRAKIEGKKRLRGKGGRHPVAQDGGVARGFKPRTAHAHIPPPPDGAAARDKIVWDALSDQPHQHASRFEKLKVRLADSRVHARFAAAGVAAMPRIRKRFQALQAARYREPIAWPGIGVALRPHADDPDALLVALDALAPQQVLLRLEPWSDDHDAEEALARAVVDRGIELSFALPQNRALVTDPKRWLAAIEEIAARFTPFGRAFQVGQAVNRSKWGVWNYGEYLDMAAVAAALLRDARPDVEVLGPAVIDFEVHVTAAIVNVADSPVRFDGLASLLYVDRRGAPENTQLGFDTADKTTLCRAIAETATSCGPTSWITEVNWPLWEGPHSPAGRSVSVDESTQASYLSRFYLEALGTGHAERVFWWQLVAAGYGLVDPRRGDLRKRPAFQAFRALGATLEGSRFLGPLVTEADTWAYRFLGRDGNSVVVAWSREAGAKVRLPAPPKAVFEQDGAAASPPGDDRLAVGPAIRFAHIDSADF